MKRTHFILVLLATKLLLLFATSSNSSSTEQDVEYGLDVSMPMTRRDIGASMLGDRQAVYDHFMEGCYEYYGYQNCKNSEQSRFERSRLQPQAAINYTETGFAKITAPPELWELVKKFWDANGGRENWAMETWAKGESATNHWEFPIYFLSIHNTTLVGGGRELQDAVWSALQSTLEAWTGQKLKGASLYGVRIYTDGSILLPHVDRLPLVSSAILNVAQETDDPWPLEVIGHDGKAHNVTMEPGDLVLYESHSILHGRPFALRGSFMANIFVHFEPVDGYDNGLLSYLQHNKMDAITYKDKVQQRNDHWKKTLTPNLEGHAWAGIGETDALRRLVEDDPNILRVRDENGWQLLHEAARGGYAATIHYLLEMGGDINCRNDAGATPLYYAESFNGVDSEAAILLRYRGAVSKAPANSRSLPHKIVARGDAEELYGLILHNHRLVNHQDGNGWAPLHEAARTTNLRIAELLIVEGATVNLQTSNGRTPLYIAQEFNGHESEIYQVLEKAGGVLLGPPIKNSRDEL